MTLKIVKVNQIQELDTLATTKGMAKVMKIEFGNDIMRRGWVFRMSDGTRLGFAHSTDDVTKVIV